MAEFKLKGNSFNTFGNLPAVGSDAGGINLTKTDLSEITCDDLKGKKVVLNVFPSIDTAVCAESVRRFNKEAAGLENTEILCVSRDLPFALGRFCGAEGIESVTPVSDFRTGAFGKEYGMQIEDGPLAGLLARSIVIIDEDGKVIYAELCPETTEEPNYEAALAALK